MKYKILKDTPTIKAGTIGNFFDGSYKFFCDAYGYGGYEYYPERIVENNPEWFEEIKSEPVETWKYIKSTITYNGKDLYERVEE